MWIPKDEFPSEISKSNLDVDTMNSGPGLVSYSALTAERLSIPRSFLSSIYNFMNIYIFLPVSLQVWIDFPIPTFPLTYTFFAVLNAYFKNHFNIFWNKVCMYKIIWLLTQYKSVNNHVSWMKLYNYIFTFVYKHYQDLEN